MNTKYTFLLSALLLCARAHEIQLANHLRHSVARRLLGPVYTREDICSMTIELTHANGDVSQLPLTVDTDGYYSAGQQGVFNEALSIQGKAFGDCQNSATVIYQTQPYVHDFAAQPDAVITMALINLAPPTSDSANSPPVILTTKAVPMVEVGTTFDMHLTATDIDGSDAQMTWRVGYASSNNATLTYYGQTPTCAPGASCILTYEAQASDASQLGQVQFYVWVVDENGLATTDPAHFTVSVPVSNDLDASLVINEAPWFTNITHGDNHLSAGESSTTHSVRINDDHTQVAKTWQWSIAAANGSSHPACTMAQLSTSSSAYESTFYGLEVDLSVTYTAPHPKPDPDVVCAITIDVQDDEYSTAAPRNASMTFYQRVGNSALFVGPYHHSTAADVLRPVANSWVTLASVIVVPEGYTPTLTDIAVVEPSCVLASQNEAIGLYPDNDNSTFLWYKSFQVDGTGGTVRVSVTLNGVTDWTTFDIEPANAPTPSPTPAPPTPSPTPSPTPNALEPTERRLMQDYKAGADENSLHTMTFRQCGHAGTPGAIYNSNLSRWFRLPDTVSFNRCYKVGVPCADSNCTSPMPGESAPTLSFAFFWDLNGYQYSGNSPCTDSIGTAHYQFHDGDGYTTGDDDCYSANSGAHFYNNQLSNGCYSWPVGLDMNVTSCNAFPGAYTPEPTPSPTPAPPTLSPTPSSTCTFPAACTTGTITGSSLSYWAYLSTQGTALVSHLELPVSSVIAIQVTDTSIFHSNVVGDTGFDLAHALANCGEVQARVTTVGYTAGNENVRVLGLDDLYYNGEWYNSTAIMSDSSVPTTVSFRILSAPMTPSDEWYQVRDCTNNDAVISTHLVMDHSPDINYTTPCTATSDGGSHRTVVVNATSACYVGLVLWDDTACDMEAPVRMLCGSTCVPYKGFYWSTGTAGALSMYASSDPACTGQFVSLPLTNSLNLDAKQVISDPNNVTEGVVIGTHYASQVFNAPAPERRRLSNKGDGVSSMDLGMLRVTINIENGAITNVTAVVPTPAPDDSEHEAISIATFVTVFLLCLVLGYSFSKGRLNMGQVKPEENNGNQLRPRNGLLKHSVAYKRHVNF